MRIHPTACVSPRARVAEDVDVGPFAVIEDDVAVGPRCRIASHAVLRSGIELGADNLVDVGAVLGGRPQHLAAGELVGRLLVGDRNHFRENVTVHTGLRPQDVTRIGDDNLIMAASHVGHDCVIGNHNIVANNVMLAGHVVVQDRAYLSGAVGVHQFCRIGAHAMVGGQARVVKDVPPYVTVDGGTTCLVGLNTIGLRRSGIDAAARRQLKQAYRVVFRSDAPWAERLEQLRVEFDDPHVRRMHEFLSQSSRGFLQDRRGPSSESIQLRVVRADDHDEPNAPRRKAS